MPLQVFAKQHPEYSFFWNWESDVRVIGDLRSAIEQFSGKSQRIDPGGKSANSSVDEEA